MSVHTMTDCMYIIIIILATVGSFWFIVWGLRWREYICSGCNISSMIICGWYVVRDAVRWSWLVCEPTGEKKEKSPGVNQPLIGVGLDQ